MNDKTLFQAIMNLPCKHGDWSGENGNMAYKIGHRDARHAAAELASEYAASHQRLKEALAAMCACSDDLAEDVLVQFANDLSDPRSAEGARSLLAGRAALRSAP